MRYKPRYELEYPGDEPWEAPRLHVHGDEREKSMDGFNRWVQGRKALGSGKIAIKSNLATYIKHSIRKPRQEIDACRVARQAARFEIICCFMDIRNQNTLLRQEPSLRECGHNCAFLFPVRKALCIELCALACFLSSAGKLEDYNSVGIGKYSPVENWAFF